MTKHNLVNKLSAVYAHLRRADTYCSNSTSIDSIREAKAIVYDTVEELGKTLKDNKEEIW